MDDEPVASLTHLTESGEAHMVDVSAKVVSRRDAEARGRVTMKRETVALIRDNLARKGDVLGVARIAGILAAKRTSDLIPLCHSLALSQVDVQFELDLENGRVDIVGRATVDGKTGVEMEALTAVSLAALTIYDMCKSVDRGMVIEGLRLTYKSGGRSGTFRQE